MSTNVFDCAVIGSGPGGYVAAIRASQLGLKTAIIEREELGGVCLNWGCIPTKALLKSAGLYTKFKKASEFGITASNIQVDFPAVMARSRRVVAQMTKGVGFLLKKNKVQVFRGNGRLKSSSIVLVTDADAAASEVHAKHIIIATGGRARQLPSLPADGKKVITYRHALALDKCPTKLLVIGAGAIGIELASFFNAFGAEVTMVEMLERVLPVEDREMSEALARALKKRGITIHTSTAVRGIKLSGDSLEAVLKSADTELTLSADCCLVAVGFEGNTEGLGLEEIGITTERSFISVNNRFETNVRGVYAIGDVIGPPLLAHVASHEGIIAVEGIAGLEPKPLNYRAVPSCVYSSPQVASVGFSEDEARDKFGEISVGKFPFLASGKAVASGDTEGLVKVVVDARSSKIVGLHIMHEEATELSGEAGIVAAHEITASSVLETVHAHPTLNEAVMEACASALGRAIHI